MHIINFDSDVEENRASQREIIKIHRINETPANNFNKSAPYISDLNPTRVSSLHRIRINKILMNNSSRPRTIDITSLVLAAWKMQGRKKLFLLFQTGITKRPLKTDSKTAIVSDTHLPCNVLQHLCILFFSIPPFLSLTLAQLCKHS